MKKVLPILLVLVMPAILFGQTKTFTSANVGRVTRFASKSDTISFSESVQRKPGAFERFVYINNTYYKFVKVDNSGMSAEEIFDGAGSKIASIPLSGPDANTIKFTDGVELKFVSTGKTTWSYTKNGTDAIKAFYYLLDEKRHYAIQWEDSTLTNPVIPAVVLEYTIAGKHIYRNKKKTGAIIAVVGISTALALMRIALDDGNDY